MSDFPQIATCSYTGFQRVMGVAVRITLSAPRWISLPNPRYTDFAKWPYIQALAPDRSYFKAPPLVFHERYVEQLQEKSDEIERQLRWLSPNGERLVLLCYEKELIDIYTCHRRQFAQWWEQRTGDVVPELGGGK